MSKIDNIVQTLKNANQPKSDFVKLMDSFDNPYLVLIACILSLRTNDKTTYPATLRMLELAKTPQEMINVNANDLEKAIYPVGFYTNKAKQIIQLSKKIVENYNGQVPCDIDELCKFNGVGRKTANVVYSEAFGGNAIAVDTHVFRVSNRLGLVNTTTPEQTEKQLNEVIPEEYWSKMHHLLIFLGRYVCKAIKPACGECNLKDLCKFYKNNNK